MRVSLLCIFLSLSLCGCGAAHATRSSFLLLGLKNDEKAKDAVMERETREFLKAKTSLLAAQGRLQPLDERQARAAFGEPVSVFLRDGSTVWAYKPSSSSWFSGEKIFLTFDGGRLKNAEYLPR